MLQVGGSVNMSFSSFLVSPGHLRLQGLHSMAIMNASSALQFKASDIFGACPKPLNLMSMQTTNFVVKPLSVEAKGNTRTENAKIRNRRTRKKFNGTPTRPRLSVFCSDKQLYAMLVDDQNKKCLFYGSTLQKSVRGDPPCSTIEAARRVGEELVKASIELKVNEISAYDRNGFARGERMEAFETAIADHGFLAR